MLPIPQPFVLDEQRQAQLFLGLRSAITSTVTKLFASWPKKFKCTTSKDVRDRQRAAFRRDHFWPAA
jgi:hypothetical protein